MSHEHYEYLPAAVDFDCCGGCNARMNDYVPWPCPTVRAERAEADRDRLQAAVDAARALAEEWKATTGTWIWDQAKRDVGTLLAELLAAASVPSPTAPAPISEEER